MATFDIRQGSPAEFRRLDNGHHMTRDLEHLSKKDFSSQAVLVSVKSGQVTDALGPQPSLADCVKWFVDSPLHPNFEEAVIHWKNEVITRREALAIYDLRSFPRTAA
jgi:hypothetical protein